MDSGVFAQNSEAVVSGLTATFKSLVVNNDSEHLQFEYGVNDPDANGIGAIVMAISSVVQSETESNNLIPDEDWFAANDADYQAMIAAIETFATKFANDYSKLITVTEPTP